MTNYSRKELNIFRGVAKLAAEGHKLTEITARQIAEAAGVGKATIYDYFSSKEEILVKSLVYSLNMHNAEMVKKLDACPDYESKMRCVFSEIIDKVEDSLSVFNIVISSGGPEKVHEYFQKTDCCYMMSEILQQVMTTFTAVTDLGISEGAITATDRRYVSMVVHAAIYSVGKEATEAKMTREDIVENAYKMLIKALN